MITVKDRNEEEIDSLKQLSMSPESTYLSKAVDKIYPKS